MFENAFSELEKSIREDEEKLNEAASEDEDKGKREDEDADSEADSDADESESNGDDTDEGDETETAEKPVQAEKPKKPIPSGDAGQKDDSLTKKVDEPKPDGQAFARLRWEAAEEKRKREELERRAKELEDKLSGKSTDTTTEEDPAKLLARELADLRKWKDEQERERSEARKQNEAIEAFKQLENQFKVGKPDYDAAAEHVATTVKTSIRMLHPTATDSEIAMAAAKWMLQTGAQAAREGINPAEQLYYLAYNQFGFQPKAEEKQETKLSKEIGKAMKPDMQKVAANRAKTTGMGSAGGSGANAEKSLEDVLDKMSQAEIAKLTPADWDRLEAQARVGR